MYIPPAFRLDDRETLTTFLREYSFGTLITVGADGPFASHLPFLYDSETGEHGSLWGHLARANAQWRHFADGREVLAIFQGPHQYVSPSWYQTPLAVPTWNYTAVHAYGVPRIISDHSAVVRRLDELVATYETPRESPWQGDLPAEFRDPLVAAIVAFEIPLTRIEGKFKLSQNRPREDQQQVAAALAQARDAQSRDVARLMRAVQSQAGPA